ncbi:hypothetical protein HETIRDRAFT_106236 [Heterobasidion irregulare TC 32-1]|uniref:DUF6534 domain-containing protein n=1 Tax=Heterobasidion irregulare (strain TC 32-1) TaxID=747525 RepID=W4JTJ3_HETIT|nr:uncharacterized protein HETIRDRAFT_106236 [Heterobasidion irregulare TC 32-1]ETW76848.1 hypothetical protein HETIRDRAFT_106236 [Heterobasidion irregulare TC 32-1]
MVHFDSTTGALYIGGLLTAILYGITCVQSFIFFQRSKYDSRTLQGTVWMLWFLDTLHLAFLSHALYWYLVTNYTNPAALGLIPWTVMAGIVVANISDCIVRDMFVWRVWRLSGKIIWPCILLVLVILVFVAGFGFGIKGFFVKSFKEFAHITWLMYVGFAFSVSTDTLIAGTLCYTLAKARTGFKRTDSLINVLMIYSINTNVVTSAFSLLCFITYTAIPRNFVFLTFYFPLSKMYINAMLASLNARESLRGQGVSTVPFSTLSFMTPPPPASNTKDSMSSTGEGSVSAIHVKTVVHQSTENVVPGNTESLDSAPLNDPSDRV